MTHVPHSLAEEFPDHVNTISTLRGTDAHFARLADEYADINRQIHRVETHVEPMSDVAAVELRKRRMHLKDEIWSILHKAEDQLTS